MLNLFVQCRFQATCEAIVRTYSCLKVPLAGKTSKQACYLRSNQIRSVGEMRSFYRTVQMDDLWHEEAKRNTPLSKSGKPMISRRAIESAAQAAKEPERRAWATVNKSDRGGRKKGGGGR